MRVCEVHFPTNKYVVLTIDRLIVNVKIECIENAHQFIAFNNRGV